MSNSTGETKSLGKKFSRSLARGDVVLLEGSLGAGKTTFIKGILKGFGFNDKEIVSPSFTIIREYKYRLFPIYHIDLYRIDKKEELINLGYQEYFYTPQGLSLIEWGQRVEDILPQYLKVTLSFMGIDKRSIRITSKGYLKEKLRFFS